MIEILQTHWELPPADYAVKLSLQFYFSRPKAHFGTGKNSHQLKPLAPDTHRQTPDLDKLIRLCSDALEIAGVLKDDKLIVCVDAIKMWTEYAAGTHLEVSKY